ncbi:MAG: PAS domain S-box protein [Bacteroidota bacterium]
MKKIIIFFLLLYLHPLYSQQATHHLEDLLQTESDTTKVALLLKLSRRYYNLDLEKSTSFAEQARDYSREIGYQHGELRGIIRMAIAQIQIGEFKMALTNLWEAEHLAKKIGDQQSGLEVNRKIARLYRTTGEYSQALRYLFDALDKLPQGSANHPPIYINIGHVYEQLGDQRQAEIYYSQAISLMREAQSSRNNGTYYKDFGKVLVLAKSYQEALVKLDSALLFARRDGNTANIARIKFWKGKVFYQLDLLEEAKKETSEAILIREKRGDTGQLLPLILLTADIHLKQETYLSAISLFETGLHLSEELGIMKERPSIFHGLFLAHDRLGDPQRAFRYYQKYIQYKDSLFNIQKSMQLLSLQTGFELEKHEEESKRLGLENQLKEEVIQKQLSFMMLVGLLFMLLIIGIRRMYNSRQQSRADYQFLFESVKEGILILEKFRITDCNQRASSFFGLDRTEILGLLLWEVTIDSHIHGNISQEECEEMVSLLEQGEFKEFEWQFPRKDGSSVWLEVSLSSYGKARENKIIALWRDISVRKEAKRTLEQEGREKDALINNTNDFIWSVDQNLRILSFNKPFAKVVFKITGTKLKKGAAVLDYNYNGRFLGKRKEYYQRALAGETFVAIEYLSFLHDGVYVNISYNPIKEGETIVGVSCFLRDVTAQIQSQKALKASEEKYRTQMERISNAFVSFDNDWNYTFVNQKASELHGYEPSYLIGKNGWELFPDVVGQPFYHTVMEAKEKQEFQHVELYYEPEDKWYENFIYPSKDGVSVFYHDITEQKNSSRKIEESQKQFELIFNSVSETMILVRYEGEEQFLLETANLPFLRILAKSGEEVDLSALIGIPLSVLGHETFMINEFHPYEMLLDRMKQAVVSRASVPYLINSIQDHQRHVYELMITPIVIDEICTHLLIVIHDFSDRFDEEERMIQEIYQALEKERTRIAREIHDNLTQTLSIASLNMKNLPYDYPDILRENKFKKSLQFIEEAIEESRGLSHRIMPKAIEDFGLIATISELVENTQEVYHIDITFEYDKKVRLPHEYELNLFRIVQESMNNIVTHANARTILLDLIIEDSYVHLEIKDDGKGFNPENRPKVMKGIGIRSMRSRTHQLDGMFTIHSHPDRGTRIAVHIPLSTKSIFS